MPFYVASSNLWFVSLLVLGNFFTSILLFYKQTVAPSKDQYIDIDGKNPTHEIAPAGQYFFPGNLFPLLL